MKRQFQILAATFITVAFISCSKEEIAKQESAITREEMITGVNASRPDPLITNLEGRFEFDGNLKEKYGKLPDGVPTARGAEKYMSDRFGNEHKALMFDGYYGVDLSNVPQRTSTSISVWLYAGWASSSEFLEVSNVLFGVGPTVLYLYSATLGYPVPQYYYYIDGGVVLSNYKNDKVESGTPFEGWHHIVVTYDGTTISHYIDGSLVGTKSFSGSIKKSRQLYKLAYAILGNGFWAGGMDDLRFYSRTLSATDVQKLYNQ